MNRVPAPTRQEGIRRATDTDQFAVVQYWADSRHEGERLLAWYGRITVGRTYEDQRQSIELALRSTDFLLPTLRRLILAAEQEWGSLRRSEFVPTFQLDQQRRYLTGLQSLWEILVEDQP